MALGWIVFLVAARALAVVHTTGDGSGNATPPADDPGFNSVGVTLNGLTGIYLGDRWVLTAAHVGETGITLGGVNYPVVVGSRVQLQHAQGVPADLALLRIIGNPPLPPLVLASTPAAENDTVTMIGNGWNRQAGQFCWNTSWVEVTCLPSSPHRGYKRMGSNRTKRWGRNVVTDVGIETMVSGMTTRSFQVDFDQSGITHEAQAVVGDSGGGVFIKRGSQWELVGVLFVINVFENQPWDTTVAFGQATLSVDVAFYRPQILATMNPPEEIPALPVPALVLAAAALAAAARRALRSR